LNARLTELLIDPLRERRRQVVIEPDRHSAAMRG
jgi:hypothetical protein